MIISLFVLPILAAVAYHLFWCVKNAEGGIFSYFLATTICATNKCEAEYDDNVFDSDLAVLMKRSPLLEDGSGIDSFPEDGN